MVILYVETNFLLSIAKGQDSAATTLLQQTDSFVHLAIPSICYMEAFSALENEHKYRKRFQEELNIQSSESRRNQISPHAQSLRFHLEQSKIENARLLEDVQARLFQALAQLATTAEMIILTISVLQDSLRTILIERDLTDNLILHCILHHARLDPREMKVFLSSNIRAFINPLGVPEALRNAGINRSFSRTQDFLGWLQSQSTL